MKKIAATTLTMFFLMFLMICIVKQQYIAFGSTVSINNADKLKTQILVKFKNDIKGDETKKNIKSKLKLKKLNLKKKMQKSKIELLEIDSSDDINSVVNEFKNDSNVEYVQPDYVLQSNDFTTNDKMFNEQWALSNTGQAIQNQVGKVGMDIEAQKAWSITTGSAILLVGVLDTGIDISHEDLKDNIFVNPKEVSKNGLDNDGNGYIGDVTGWNFADDNNQVFSSYSEDKHGTHVAGIIAASANKKGIIGIAPNIKIVPLKFMKDNSGYTSDAIDAIEYASKMGIQIINCSFGGTDYNQALKDAMQSSGLIFVCAGGNSGISTAITPIYPAAYDLPNVISVAAVDNTGNLASFSTYGPNIDIAAPGVNILSTTPGNKYEYMSGTSMAAPYVTGVAALMKSEYSNIENKDIIATIEGSSQSNYSLKDKVTSNGIVDAYKALMKTNTLYQSKEKINNQLSMISKVQEDMLALAQKNATLKGIVIPCNSSNDKLTALDSTGLLPYAQQIHFGEDGVSFTGNYCSKYVDMVVNSPGFEISISRTYNSQNYSSGPLGIGWRFGFQGSIITDPNNASKVIVTLPSGGVQTFNSVGADYVANDSRSVLIKVNNLFRLTTKDHYIYNFSTYGFLNSMTDKNGNTVTIVVDSTGKITQIKDTVDRPYTITYNSSNPNLIDNIKDPIGRTVTYHYNTSNCLTEVIDPTGNKMSYDYDSDYGYGRFLNVVKDSNSTIIQNITYNHYGTDINKISSVVDEFGKQMNYTYYPDYTGLIVKYYSSSGMFDKFIIIFNDTSGYRTSTFYYKTGQDTDSGGTHDHFDSIGYNTVNGINYYGDILYTENNIIMTGSAPNYTYLSQGVTTFYYYDSNGNVTSVGYGYYDKDSNGNVLSTTQKYNWVNKTYANNNLTIDSDENYKTTYYCYDTNNNIIKKLQPINSWNVYSPGCDESQFAVTNYVYYTDAEALANGYKAKGLLHYTIDPAGKRTDYTYDPIGNIKTISVNGILVTTNTYNGIGWLTHNEAALKKYTTDYSYDNDGRLEKTVLNNGETSRSTYDGMGRNTKIVLPKQYVNTDDGLNDATQTHTYRGNVGTRYTYNTSRSLGYGNVQSATDAEGNTTLFTYDMYGNVQTKTMSNNSVYRYTYDFMNRPLNVYFKDSINSSETLLESYSYVILYDGTVQTSCLNYLNSTDVAKTINTSDYAGRIICQKMPSNRFIITVYNPNGTIDHTTDANQNSTFYTYDNLNRLIGTWTPVEVNLYMYKGIEYDKAGNKITEKTSKDKVAKYYIPTNDRLIIKSFQYNADGRLQYVYVGTKLMNEYAYDLASNVSKEIDYQDINNKVITEFDNNQLGRPISKTVHIKTGDIYGNSFDNSLDKLLVTNYHYDNNGNLDTLTTPDQVITSYQFDNLNRQIKVSQPGQDEYGNNITIAQSTAYNWENKPLVTTKFKINNSVNTTISTTTNTYNSRDLLATTDVLDNTNGNHIINAYYYDLAGRKIADVDPKNYDSTKALIDMNRTEYTYDIMGRLLTKTEVYKPDPSINTFNRIVSLNEVYDSNGNITYEQDALGYVNGYGKTYSYNFANEQSTILDAVSKDRSLSYTMKYDYDGAGRKVAETNAKGAITKFYYDDFNNVTSTAISKTVNDPEKIVKSDQYDNLGNITRETDGNGNITNYEYNVLNKLRKATYPSDITIPSYIVSYQYDVMGNLKSKQDSLNKVDIYTYDNQNRQLSHSQQSVSGDKPITTSVKYDINGNSRFITDGNGVITEVKYDGINRQIETDTYATNLNNVKTTKVVNISYDKNCNLISQTDVWRGITSTYDYDPLNKLIAKKVDGKTIQKLEYDNNGSQTKSYDAPNDDTQNFRITQFSYDKNSRLIKTIDPKLNSVSQDYDDVGNIKTKTDARNNTTTYNYDEFNRLISVVNPKLETTSYSYDGNGNKLTQTDGKGNITTYEYNVANKLSRVINNGGRTGTPGSYVYSPDKTESYTYLASGNLNMKVDRNGNTTNFVYDIHDRLTTQTAMDTIISYTYDGNDNELTMTDAVGNTTYTYDEENRIKTKTGSGIGTTSYLYDILLTGSDTGCLKEVMTDAKGNITNKTYDRFDRLYRVNADNATNSTTYAYYDNGSRKSITNPDGSTEVYKYYIDGSLNTLTNAKGSWSETFTYTYDAAHNMLSKVDSKGTTNYTYDNLNRLQSVSEPGGKLTAYTYDASGNRVSESITQNGVTLTTNYHYNDRNILTSTDKAMPDGSIVSYVYSYDNNGNLILKTKENTKNVIDSDVSSLDMLVLGQSSMDAYTNDIAYYQYDGLNELVSSINGTNNLQYTYYGDGLRATKSNNGVQIKYLYEDDKVILELDSSGNQIARNVEGLNLIARTVNGQTVYYMYNGHADVTALIDSTGTAVGTYYYDAFGNITSPPVSFNNNITYAGYQYDSETGLYYLNSRMYDPVTARFLQEDDPSYGDPNDPLSLNLYTYCTNDPIGYDDPNGHHQINDSGAIPVFVINPGVVYASVDLSSSTSFVNNGSADKVLVAAGSSVSITNNANIGIVSTGTNSSTDITNNAKIVTISTGTNANLNLNNSSTGTIGTVTTGTKSTTVVVNDGRTGIITTGTGSSTVISNDGNINLIKTGAKSTDVIVNDCNINSIQKGTKSKVLIDNSGYLGNDDPNIKTVAFHGQTIPINIQDDHNKELMLDKFLLGNSPFYNSAEAITGYNLGTGSKLTNSEQQKIALNGGFVFASGMMSIQGGIEEGEFSIINWEGYPKNGIKPDGTFKLIDGNEYVQARQLANKTNQAMHKADPSLKGNQIHEVKPVKFDGSPTDKANKIILTQKEHIEYTNFWNNLKRMIEQK